VTAYAVHLYTLIAENLDWDCLGYRQRRHRLGSWHSMQVVCRRHIRHVRRARLTPHLLPATPHATTTCRWATVPLLHDIWHSPASRQHVLNKISSAASSAPVATVVVQCTLYPVPRPLLLLAKRAPICHGDSLATGPFVESIVLGLKRRRRFTSTTALHRQ
jgi:hypothetical protein